MTDLQVVDESNFDQVVLGADKPVLVDFWAQSCPPCHQIVPVLAQIAMERQDRLSVVKSCSRTLIVTVRPDRPCLRSRAATSPACRVSRPSIKRRSVRSVS